MLEQLILRNFQNHTKAVYELSSTVTTLTGKSESGKSAIIRALSWLLFNKPRGDRFIHHGTATASAKLTFDGGHTVLRRVGPHGNLYRLDETDYKAFGAEVPEEISKVLNVSPMSLARQFDQHFWLFQSAGEVSRELNAIVDLGVIDKALAAAASEVRNAYAELQSTKVRLTQAEETVAELCWVPSYLKAVEELESKEKELAAERHRSGTLRSASVELRKVRAAASDSSRLALAAGKAVLAGAAALTAREQLNSLRELLKLIRTERKKIDVAVPDLAKLQSLKDKVDSLKAQSSSLRSLIREARKQSTKVTELQDQLSGVMEKLAAVEQCPLCGRST